MWYNRRPSVLILPMKNKETVYAKIKGRWRVAAAFGLTALLVMACPLVSCGQEGAETYLGVALDLNALYIWRGMAWSQGAVLQPSAWTNLLGYNLMIWANYPLSRESGRAGFNELDFFVQGTTARRAFNVVPGLNLYSYPGSAEEDPSTAELTMTFYIPVGPVWIYQENNLDIAAYVGAYYAEFGLEMGNSLSETLSWEASLSLSYASADFNQAYLDVSQAALTAVGLHFGGEIRVAGAFGLRPHIEVCRLLQDFMRGDSGSPWRANIGLSIVWGQD